MLCCFRDGRVTAVLQNPCGNRASTPHVVILVRIDIWSDVACPWCYVGKRRLEAALADFEHQDDVDIWWHSFELDQQAPSGGPGEHAALLSGKYGMSLSEAEQALDRMRVTAGAEGLDLRFDLARSGRTFDAHRVLQLAADRGIQGPVKERLMRAYFTEGADMTDHQTLVGLGVECGLNAEDVASMLAGSRYADEVRADESQAQQLGITGVPFFVIDGKFGVSGAQSSEVFTDALTRAWSDRAPLTQVGEDGEACAVDAGIC
jgi:predicted DsbA family dithiol-disulfide isomerase